MGRGGRHRRMGDNQIQGHAIRLSTRKMQEQLKDPQRHFRRPEELAKGNDTAPDQLLAWNIDFKVSLPFILAFEQLMLRLATVHSSLIAH